jgi:hypothetical protein
MPFHNGNDTPAAEICSRETIKFNSLMVWLQQQTTTQVMLLLLLQFWQECCSGYDLAAKSVRQFAGRHRQTKRCCNCACKL